MIIAVGSVYFDVFETFFESFSHFNPEYIPRLVVYLDWISPDAPRYDALARRAGFKVEHLSERAYRRSGLERVFKNVCCYSLYCSLQHPEVVRLDDDVLFTSSGLFPLFTRLLKANRITGESYISHSDGPVLASYAFGIRGVQITDLDFHFTPENMHASDGCDTHVLGQRWAHEVYFCDSELEKSPERGSVRSYSRTRYYTHFGGITNDTLPNRRSLTTRVDEVVDDRR